MIKLLTKTLASLVGLFVLAIVLITSFVDPNNYKDLVIKKAQDYGGVSLVIDGSLSWSLFPVGFKVEQISLLTSSNEPFANAAKLELSVDMLSLLMFSPVVNGVYIDEGAVQLIVDAHGTPNWRTLIAARNESAWQFVPVSEEQSLSASEINNEASTSQLKFLVESIEVSDFSATYRNMQSDKNIDVKNLSFTAHDTAPNQAFPVSVSYDLSYPEKRLHIQHSLDSMVRFTETFDTISASGMEHTLDISSPLTKNESLQLSLTGDLAIDLRESTMVGDSIQASGAGVALDASFSILDFNDSPSSSGIINIAPLDVKQLLARFSFDSSGIPSGLKNISLKAPFEFDSAGIESLNFAFQIDQTTGLGRVAYRFQDKEIDLSLKADSLDLNEYLDTASSTFTLPTIAAITSNPDNSAITRPILPLDLLSEINLILSLKQDHLRYGRLDFTQLSVQAAIENGMIEISEANAQLLNGSIESSANINTRLPIPKWSARVAANGVEALRLVNGVAIGEHKLSGEGRFFAEGNVSAFGNTIASLKRSNSGEAAIRIEDGQLSGVNLNKKMCEGFASIRGAEIINREWSSHTDIRALTGTLSLDNGLVASNDLQLETLGLLADGVAQYDINQELFNYDLAIRPTMIPERAACQINPKFENVSIPLICNGQLTPLEHTCQLNTAKIIHQAAVLANQELSRKANKEVHRALGKAIDKYVDKNSELGKIINNSISNRLQ